MYKQIRLTKEFVCNCAKCGKPYVVNVTQEQFNEGKYKKNCSRSCANGHKVTDETKKKISNGMKKLQNHAERPYRCKTYFCKFCNKPFTVKDIRDTSGLRYCSSECRHKWLSEHTGGYQTGAGYGKHGWYKGIHCDSSWELAFLIYHLEHNLPIKRCTEKRKYTWKNEEHVYIPDFVTNDGIVEIKGYKTKQWEAKEKCNKDIIVLYGNEMKKYLDYVINKYGDNFINLYEN